MKKIVKILSVLMSALMMFTSFSVSAAAAKAPKLTKTSITVSVGKKYQLYVNYATDSITWSSSDTKIATVKKGLVTAKKAGTVTITAKHGDISLDCKVKVKSSSVKIPSTSENSTVTTYNKHTYAIFNTDCTWEEAKKYCEKLGGHLVTISDEDEQDFIIKLLKKNKKNNKNCYWTGLYKKSNTWKWADGSKFKYTNWAPNEPNSYDGEEAYVHLFGTVYTGGTGTKNIGDWNDASMDGAGYANEFYALENFGYICEWDTTN